MRVYLAGPMRGLHEFNFPAFFEAEAQLRDLGLVVENPARVDDEAGVPWRGAAGSQAELDVLGFDIATTMALDMEIIALRCDAVCVLPGWERSSGARAEVALAQAIGSPVVALRYGAAGYRLVELEVVTRMEIAKELQVGIVPVSSKEHS